MQFIVFYKMNFFLTKWHASICLVSEIKQRNLVMTYGVNFNLYGTVLNGNLLGICSYLMHDKLN